ncbi:hypothetical protein JCM10212_006843 [Sporobolomyces blumeae]
MPPADAASTSATLSTRTNSGGQTHHDDARRATRQGSQAMHEKEHGHRQEQRGSWRSKLPGLLSGPLEALFPAKRPSPIYGADLPPFILEATRRATWTNRKNLFRASIVSLGAFILVLEDSSLQVFGQAAFFGALITFFLPPTFPVMLLLIVTAMLVFGMCLGWAWGVAAMAAAFRARSQALLAANVQRAQAALAGSPDPATAYRKAIFSGDFLDPRSTVVFGVFLGVGTFFLGLVRAHRPKLTLLAVFGAIVLDIMCSYGALFPTRNYTLAKLFLIPTGAEVAIALAATLLIFPTTLNSSYTTDLVDKFLSPILQRSHLHSKLLSTPPPDYTSPREGDADRAWQGFQKTWLSTQEAMAGGLEALFGSTGLMELEVSYGRLGAKDLASLSDSLKELLARSVGLAVLNTVVVTRRKHVLEVEHEESDSSSHGSNEKRDERAHFTETSRMRRFRRRFDAVEAKYRHDLPSLLPVFESASLDLRTACDDALLASMTWLTSQNHARWKGQPKADKVEAERSEQRARVAKLESELERYRREKRHELLEPFADFFDPKTGRLRSEASDSLAFSPNTLLTLMAASDNFLCYADALLDLVRRVAELQDRRTRNKLWFPTKIRKIGNLLKGGHGQGNTFAGDRDDPEEIEVEDEDEDDSEHDAKKSDKEKEKQARRRVEEVMSTGYCDPDARPPRSYQKVTIFFHNFGQWLKKPETIFAIRFTIVSIALWLPQVFKTSAQISYEQKLIWALIMAQTGLAVYAGDQILSTIQRVLGTAWYIGAANGPGSRIGLGAAFYVLTLPLLAVRIFGPPASVQMVIMAAATTVLIVGYSFIDNHLAMYGQPGVGYQVAWRRAVLVLIGIAAATIVMLFPAQSSRVYVRKTHATTIQALGRVYTGILSAWVRDSATTGDDKDVEAFSKPAQNAARAKLLALRVKLNASKIAIIQSKYEVSLRGDWPQDEYFELFRIQMHLLQALSQVGHCLSRLDPVWRRRLVTTTAFLKQPLVADTTATFALVSLALRQGFPLPLATPGPLIDRLLYHDARLRALSSDPDSKADEVTRVEGASMGKFDFTFDVLKHESFSIYANALQGLASILLDLDELELAAKSLVGVSSFPGYESLLNRPSEA